LTGFVPFIEKGEGGGTKQEQTAVYRRGEVFMGWYLDVLKQFTVFTGRTLRRDYWMFVLVTFIIGFVLGLVTRAVGNEDIIFIPYFLAVVVFGLAAAVRRLHDVGLSGWWLLVGFVPFVGSVIVLILLAWRGKPTENRFGPVPTPIAPPNPEQTERWRG
jgi:uncharacterized membrane protein YhaH (DUF805 family)